MDNLQTLTTMGTQNIGPRQTDKKLPHQNAEKSKQMTNMDPTTPLVVMGINRHIGDSLIDCCLSSTEHH
jgi:hypothetical protein